MSSSIKDTFDRLSLVKDIDERETIISNYLKFGFLDRDNAIRIILELRRTDEDVAATTAVNLSISSTPFSQSTNEQIIGELAMQRNILQIKLANKQAEGSDEH